MSEQNRQDETFNYTYSARQQEEIKAIRKKYMPSEEDKMEQLRRLDAIAPQKGTLAALAASIPSCLLLGVGMCCTMVWGGGWFVPGIIIGLAGICGMALAYPIYNRVVKKEREKLAPEIIRLTEELLK